MTSEDDRRAFVLARWPDLEAVALLVVADPVAAQRVTTDALAGVVGRWREAVDAGRPSDDARRDLLRRAVTVASGERPAAPARSPTGPLPDDEGEPEDAVVLALLAAVRSLGPLGRALVAARLVWDSPPDEVAALLGRPAGEVVAADEDARARLAAAHDGAREAEGLGPAPWLLEADLRAAVARVHRSLSDPPDPVALVAERAGGLRRRQLLVGGVATAAVATAGWWVAGGAARRSPAPASTALAVDSPVWDTTRRWPARGRLASSSDVQALVIRDAPRGSRLLFADDVGDRCVVVASPADISGRDGVRLVVWTGPRGAPPGSLQQVSLARDGLSGVRDVVALVVAQDVGDALLVVAPPRLESASYAPVATPTPAGGWVRTFATLALADGIGVELVGRGLGPATWVSAGGYQGAPAGTPRFRPELLPGPSPEDYARDRRLAVSELTGIPDGLLSTRVVADSPVDAAALDPGSPEAAGTTGRVVVVHTRTPDDAVIRSVRVTTGPAGARATVDVEDLAVVAAGEAGGPALLRLPARGRPERFLVVAPGAARVRLLSSAPGERPVTRFVRCTGASAVLSVPDSRQEAAYRLLVEDAGGRELFRGRPPGSSELA